MPCPGRENHSGVSASKKVTNEVFNITIYTYKYHILYGLLHGARLCGGVSAGQGIYQYPDRCSSGSGQYHVGAGTAYGGFPYRQAGDFYQQKRDDHMCGNYCSGLGAASGGGYQQDTCVYRFRPYLYDPVYLYAGNDGT